jgi:hypothetical protein
MVHVVTTALEELSLILNSTSCMHISCAAKFRPTNKYFKYSGIVVGYRGVVTILNCCTSHPAYKIT